MNTTYLLKVSMLFSIFLILIPKKSKIISLVGGLYKILIKVLANRIKRVMSLIISQA